MKKKFFILFIFTFTFIFFPRSFLLASNINCTNLEKKNDVLISQNHLELKFIEVDIKNFRKWTKNNIKIITSNSRYIDEKYKKRFSANIKVTFSDNSKCEYKAFVRQSGDAKDHITLQGNDVLQSLDILLENGNIKGITKFKLFKPDVRGNINDVIILGNLLRNFGYLAPRSMIVNARVNKTNSIMLFQEKAVKEMLEYNSRREGPILESDQKFFFNLVKKIPQNNLSNWSSGIPELENKTIKTMLAKSTNGKLTERSLIHKKIFLDSIDKLNYMYLYWSNRFDDEKNKFYFFDYELDNNLLALFDPKNTIKLDIYNILLQSTNSEHALSLSNRKFFWNSIENYFEPINYDSNPEIDRDRPTTTSAELRYPISEYYLNALIITEKKLKEINIDEFNKKLFLDGLKIDINYAKSKIDKILSNLTILKKNYIDNANKSLIDHNKFLILKNISKKFNDTLLSLSPDTLLVIYKQDKTNFEICEINFLNCKELNLSTKDMAKLLDGELYINDKNVVYFGNKDKSDLNLKINNLNSLKIEETDIFFEEGINVEVLENQKKINFYQNKLGARAYLINGVLENYKFNFIGDESIIKKDINFKPINFPINEQNITGCITFINLNLLNVDISASNSSCEDAVNMINVKGTVNIFSIKRSYQDALDLDFSQLKINKIQIDKSMNDCVDFSYGNYLVEQMIVNDCGDKGLSVGENSSVILNKANITKTSIGIASKDSSTVSSNLININNTDTCLAAYNKKQEFLGGELKVNKLSCINYKNIFEKDSYSNILIENKE